MDYTGRRIGCKAKVVGRRSRFLVTCSQVFNQGMPETRVFIVSAPMPRQDASRARLVACLRIRIRPIIALRVEGVGRDCIAVPNVQHQSGWLHDERDR